jgi:hypothetical protein
MREYGSEHHWQSRGEYETGRGQLNIEGWQLYRSGRDALKQVARLNPGKKVLLPALCCESMILPFTMNGCRVEFYKLTDQLKGDWADVLSKADGDTVLLYMTYFDIQPFETEFLARLRDKGVFLLEDRTQDIIVPRAETIEPDVTIASIRKWAALPEGGLLKTSLSVPKAKTDERFARLRRAAMEEKGLYLESGEPGLKTDFLSKLHQADELLDESGEPIAMSESSKAELIKLDFEKILSKRRANVRILERELAGLNIKTLTQGESTAGLYYPILVENRNKVQRGLAQRNIYCPAIWPVPEEALGVCKNAEHTAEHILAIPCDQRYSENDMVHIAQAIKEIIGEM